MADVLTAFPITAIVLVTITLYLGFGWLVGVIVRHNRRRRRR